MLREELPKFIKHAIQCPQRSTFLLEWVGCETKPPILDWDRTVNFENGTNWPILIKRQNRQFQSGIKLPICKNLVASQKTQNHNTQAQNTQSQKISMAEKPKIQNTLKPKYPKSQTIQGQKTQLEITMLILNN